jgi:8-oxo-dGTP diphosphatase
MFKHDDGTFDFPGGRMEWKESIMEALNRELKEELDYSLEKEPELFSVYNYISENGERHSVLIQYIQKLNKMPVISSPEKVNFIWLSKKDIESTGIINDGKFINKIFNY